MTDDLSQRLLKLAERAGSLPDTGLVDATEPRAISGELVCAMWELIGLWLQCAVDNGRLVEENRRLTEQNAQLVLAATREGKCGRA